MDINSNEDLLEHVNTLIDFLSEHEDVFYVPLEVAHQLRDEIVQVISKDPMDE
jgi:hypothetical protein